MSNEKRKYRLTGRNMRDVVSPKYRMYIGESYECESLENGTRFGIKPDTLTSLTDDGRVRDLRYVSYPDGTIEILEVKYRDILNSELL